MIALMAVGAVGFVMFVAGLALQGRTPRIGIGMLVPLAFAFVPLLQSLPIPLGARNLLDPAGNVLLRDNQVVVTRAWPLSLDPPNTRVDVGRATLALVALLVAYHLASGQSRRHLIVRSIGLAGVVGVVIGLGHHVLGISKLYGTFNATGRSLMMGPFVNSNHTAEFLELAAFACLACSFQRSTALNRVGWLVGMLLCVGGATATLSRGAVVALATGTLVFIFVRHFSGEHRADGSRHRVSLAWGALVLGVITLGMGALGAGQLIDRFKTDAVTTDVRLRLWREGLRVFAAHPFGIGRGAFDRVFPIYHSFKVFLPLRFAFVENEPLQLLIDCGWFFFLCLLAALAIAAWQVLRRGRHDKIEAALCAGLLAVLAHSTVDFGLETLGVLLPFTALLGTLLGRLDPPPRKSPPSMRMGWSVTALVVFGLVFGVAATANSSYDDFDALLKKRMTPDARKALLIRAEETRPLDYFYALEEAQLEPIKGTPGLPSPRLHALNRALRLCPSCEAVHVEVARSLWRIGLRQQALVEWRTAVGLQPLLFDPALDELFAAGAKPEELTAVASSSPEHMLKVVSFLAARLRLADAFVVLDQADALGNSGSESLLTRAELQLQAGQKAAAAVTIKTALAAGVREPRLAVLQTRLLLGEKGPEGADQALADLDLAAARYPTDVDVQRARLDVVTRYKKWQAASRSIEGLKSALYQTTGSATDALIAGARIQTELGHGSAALGEYRIAVGERSNDVSLWLEYARTAAGAGHDGEAREALSQAARLSPNSPDILNEQRELSAREARRHSLLTPE
jgi:tetratricopeptide (TPR) repeat protein